MISIRWMKEQLQIHSVRVHSMALHLKEISRQFQEIIFSHVYKELNMQVNSLSKEGLLMLANNITEDEFLGGSLVSSRTINIYEF